MSTNTTTPTTKVVSPKKSKVRFSYAHVFEPVAANEGEKPKYSVSILIDKDDKALIKQINDAVEAAAQQGKDSKFGGKVPKNLKLPLRDGDEEREDDPAYENKYFLNASSFRKVGILDETGQDIIDPDDFYSGCYGRFSVNFYPFNVSGNKGVACGLNNLQKLEDGERLSGGSSAASDFGYDEDDDLM